MERMWTGEVSMKYPEKWIVLVNISREKNPDIKCDAGKVIGDVYLITQNKDEAYDTAIAVRGKMGKTTVVEGFNPHQSELGGLYRV